MTAEEIMERLATAQDFPADALREAVPLVADIKPRIVELARKVLNGICLLPREEQLLFYGLHVVAATKDRVLCSLLRGIAERPEEDIDRLLGDGSVEALARLLISTYDGDEDALLEALLAESTEESGRWSLFLAAAGLAHAGRIDRQRLHDLLVQFEQASPIGDDDLSWMGWQETVITLGLADLEPALRRMWDKVTITDNKDIELKDAVERLAAVAANPADVTHLTTNKLLPIDDPVEALSWVEKNIASHSSEESQSSPVDTRDASGLSGDETVWLASFLASEQVPESTMTIEMLDGFFTGLIAGPAIVPMSEYMVDVWGSEEGEEPAFDSREQAQYVMDLMMRRWNSIADGIMRGTPAPPIIIDYGDAAMGQDWAEGFLTGLDFHEELHATPKQEKRTSELVEPIVALVEHIYGVKISAKEREAVLGRLPALILKLAGTWRPGVAGVASQPARSVKIGRNDPCPCGSGKKYKKCCGAGSSSESVH